MPEKFWGAASRLRDDMAGLGSQNEDVLHARVLLMGYLRDHGITESELAERCKVSQGWVNKIKNGRIGRVTPQVLDLFHKLEIPWGRDLSLAPRCLTEIYRACDRAWNGRPERAREIIAFLDGLPVAD